MTPFFLSDSELRLIRKIIGNGMRQLDATPCFTDEHYAAIRSDSLKLQAIDNALNCAVIEDYRDVYVITTHNAMVVDEATQELYAGHISPEAYYEDIDEVFYFNAMSLRHAHTVVERALKEGKHVYLASKFQPGKDGREGYTIWRELT